MSWLGAIRRQFFAQDVAPSPAPVYDSSAGELQNLVQNLRIEVDYLQLEVSRLRSLVRYLMPNAIAGLPLQQQTKDSFDFQWSSTEDGDWIKNRPELKEREPRLVCQFTTLEPEWFKGKRVLDAGCGSGRFSFAMASMGASVVAVDQSAAGVAQTKNACAEFGAAVEVFQQDLTKPLALDPTFDLVWSFGVLHHTGDTYGAFRNIAKLVKSGGHLFMMLYGEPTGKEPGEFAYYTEVERLRRETCDLPLSERYSVIEKNKGSEAGGWFDAVSPNINDTYAFYEIRLWLLNASFIDVKRTMNHSSHHVVARKR